MFSKIEKNFTYIASSPSVEKVDDENELLSQQLCSLVKLLEKKYQLDDVKARFTSSDTNTISIVLFNGMNGPAGENIDEANKKPIEYLGLFSTDIKKEPYKYPYWSNSIVTIERSKIEELIEGLELLATPSEPAEPRMVARC